MSRKLTKKQKGFVKDYLATGNGGLAASKNYNVSTDESARAIASQNLMKKPIINAVEEAFPDSELFKLHREGLYDEDLYIRHKYLDTSYKLKGSYAPEKSVSLNIEVPVGKQRVATDAVARFLNGNQRNTTE